MDSTAVLLNALKISETAISCSSLIATWIGGAVAAITILFTAGFGFFGVRYFLDKKLVERKVKESVGVAMVEIKANAARQSDDDRASIRKELDPIRKQIAEIWLRNVVTSEKKDLYAIKKAIETAIESASEGSILPMIQELHSYATKFPEQVGGFIWEIQGFPPVIEKAKVFFKDQADELKMVSEYWTAIDMIHKENAAKKEAIKRRLDKK